MRKSYILIALAMVAALTTVSCKCSSNKPQEPTQEEVQEMKQALADSVLADIDAIVEDYSVAFENGFHIQGLELTEQEKIVKPDYLLDPAEVNYHFDMDAYEANIPLSERIKMDYKKCVENGDQASFWLFQNAVIFETSYILAQNPELFFSKITDEQWTSYNKTWQDRLEAMNILARYDEEFASALEPIKKTAVCSSSEERKKANSSKESAKQFRIANRDKYIARRNALLQ